VELSELLPVYAFCKRYSFYMSMKSWGTEVYLAPEFLSYGARRWCHSLASNIDEVELARRDLRSWIEDATSKLTTHLTEVRLARTVTQAIENHDMERLVSLLQSDSRYANAANSFGWTPLFTAVSTNQIEAVRLLIDHGAQVNPKPVFNALPLDWAVLQEREEISKLLLENGARTLLGVPKR
jgi:ankyrin repeat protein